LRAQGAAPRYESTHVAETLAEQRVLGAWVGTCVDARDHVFILNRQDVLEGN